MHLAKDEKSFVVTPAVTGQSVDPASFQDVVAAAARHLTPATATVEFDDRAPAVTTAAAREVADAANAIVRTRVAVSDGEESHAASSRTKASWVGIPLTAGRPGPPTVDAAKVADWVSEVADEVATDPTPGLRYLDTAGSVRKVVTEAQDGRTVANAATVSRALAASITAGKASTGKFTYKAVPATWEERRIAPGAENLAYPAAVGEKWVDVNLSRHTMTAYVGAGVVYGPIAMVNGAEATPTSVGTFHVYLKNPLMTMKGRNADGTNYETPDVPWSSFFVGGIALHGAPWRSSFGFAASHGCINLPVSAAKWVYDFAPVGTTVVSHF